MNSALQRLGLTRSNQVIYQLSEITYASFAEVTRLYSKSDHFDAFDAYALFQFLIGRELRRHGRTSTTTDHYHANGHFHEFALSKQEFAQEMRSLSLATIFDLAKHGSNLSDHIFHD